MSTQTFSHGGTRYGSYRRLSLAERILAALAVQRQRTQLGQLDDHMLHDIGLSREDADREASRPVWDAPAHWSK
ncbi:DUF1127 domain-containing protein [Pseudoruegeria sp. HB172150]|uniref:DUF1127 domain-containing protein n=1 Tax=Pseudoruegeria sp. HB172150 TaxID=2721164 RepID=UPI0015538E30|nr:DUF1127 domain-containing protein [Pseudoruegeria sp. HB172150]